MSGSEAGGILPRPRRAGEAAVQSRKYAPPRCRGHWKASRTVGPHQEVPIRAPSSSGEHQSTNEEATRNLTALCFGGQSPLRIERRLDT